MATVDQGCSSVSLYLYSTQWRPRKIFALQKEGKIGRPDVSIVVCFGN
jgi:hypothetical protein